MTGFGTRETSAITLKFTGKNIITYKVITSHKEYTNNKIISCDWLKNINLKYFLIFLFVNI